MMFILSVKNSIYTIFLLLFFLTSCHIIMPIEPVKPVNDDFLIRYGTAVDKAKKKHYKIMKKNQNNNDVDISETAYGRLIQREIEFRKKNAENNPYVVAKRAGGGHIEYISYNAGPYKEHENNIFDEIEIPKYDFHYYKIGDKEFNEVSNIELQEAYDYIYVIEKEKIRNEEVEKLKQQALSQEEYQNASLIKKSQMALKNLSDRIKQLINQ